MKSIKIVSACALALSTVVLTPACSMFESDDEKKASEFYFEPVSDDAAGNKNKGGADLGAGEDGVGGYGKEGELPDGAYIDGFGARIPGVEFEPIYFKFDQDVILSSEEAKARTVADYLAKNPQAGVVIEGNCDERGTDEYNRALGEKRALAAKIVIIQLGIGEDRIKTISYGESKPAVQGNDESAWEKNRRDDFIPVYLK